MRMLRGVSVAFDFTNRGSTKEIHIKKMPLFRAVLYPILSETKTMVSQKFLRAIAALAASACLFTPVYTGAAVVSPGVSVAVTQSWAYASLGGGDFVFGTSIGASGCENGWYVKTSDPGYKAAVATVLAAQASGKLVLVYGDNADIWFGSGGHYCRLQAVGFTS